MEPSGSEAYIHARAVAKASARPSARARGERRGRVRETPQTCPGRAEGHRPKAGSLETCPGLESLEYRIEAEALGFEVMLRAGHLATVQRCQCLSDPVNRLYRAGSLTKDALSGFDHAACLIVGIHGIVGLDSNVRDPSRPAHRLAAVGAAELLGHVLRNGTIDVHNENAICGELI